MNTIEKLTIKDLVPFKNLKNEIPNVVLNNKKFVISDIISRRLFGSIIFHKKRVEDQTQEELDKIDAIYTNSIVNTEVNNLTVNENSGTVEFKTNLSTDTLQIKFHNAILNQDLIYAIVVAIWDGEFSEIPTE